MFSEVRAMSPGTTAPTTGQYSLAEPGAMEKRHLPLKIQRDFRGKR
jgi:hypothetical protein